MIIKGVRRNIAASKKVEKPAAAPKKEREAQKVEPVIEPILPEIKEEDFSFLEEEVLTDEED